MMLRVMILGLVTALLSGCYYSQGCFYGPQSSDCPFQPKVTAIQRWQKKDSIGSTDPEKRWKDFKECGGQRVTLGKGDKKYDEIYYDRSAVECMKGKSYIQLGEYECRTKSQTKLNGKCN